MPEVVATSWPSSPTADAPGAFLVHKITFLDGDLQIEIHRCTEGQGQPCATVEFKSVIGYRVLDERDLLDFEPLHASRCTCVHEIHAGGWLDQEKQRPDNYLDHGFYDQPREWFISSWQYCVAVLCEHEPCISLNA